MTKIITSLLVAGIFLSACLPNAPSVSNDQTSPEETGLTACTKEAKVCPNGSTVGRVGPNCEFEACPQLEYKNIPSAEIKNLAGPFDFSVQIPAHWQVEAVSNIEAINFYDPSAPGDNNLDRSQIFIRHFSGSGFLTLNTVEIFSRSEVDINGRDAVVYDIEKNPSAADFPNQPAWRNSRHSVTDIRTSNQSPAIFYVIGKRPSLDQAIFDKFIQSLSFAEEEEKPASQTITSPIADYRARVTKKPFGIYITPENSPVAPEKFSGYHAGIDVEYEDVSGDVPVYAVGAGKVLRSGWVSGYGGMVAATQEINGTNYIAIFGHMDPDVLPAVGAELKPNQQIGILGEGFTDETDGERKHLHFSLYGGSSINVRGYVQSENELSTWADPLKVLP